MKRKISKKGRTKSNYQTGKQTKRGYRLDKKRKAKKPGKRISRTGKVYYERRKNRSDKDRRKRV